MRSRPAMITPANRGRAGNKRWWDFILEPEETGIHILSTENAVWLDRERGIYRTVPVDTCTLDVTVIPRQPGEILLPENGRAFPPGSVCFWWALRYSCSPSYLASSQKGMTEDWVPLPAQGTSMSFSPGWRTNSPFFCREKGIPGVRRARRIP